MAAARGALRAGLHYVVINLIGSGAVPGRASSLLYAIDRHAQHGRPGAVRVAQRRQRSRRLVRAGGLLLLVVFALKAALFPLYFWLPRAYAPPRAPVAALFAIMTKVGVYAILRVYTLVFGAERRAGRRISQAWLLAAGAGDPGARHLGALAGAQPAHHGRLSGAWPRSARCWRRSAVHRASARRGAVLPAAQHAGDRRAVPAVRT